MLEESVGNTELREMRKAFEDKNLFAALFGAGAADNPHRREWYKGIGVGVASFLPFELELMGIDKAKRLAKEPKSRKDCTACEFDIDDRIVSAVEYSGTGGIDHVELVRYEDGFDVQYRFEAYGVKAIERGNARCDLRRIRKRWRADGRISHAVSLDDDGEHTFHRYHYEGSRLTHLEWFNSEYGKSFVEYIEYDEAAMPIAIHTTATPKGEKELRCTIARE
jgi:hypothetical protein